jgi:hypothetical protein
MEQPLIGRPARTPASAAWRARIAAGDVGGNAGAAAPAGDGAGCSGVIKAWRLSKARYTADLSGLGVARDGQRWNPPGQPAVYLGPTPEPLRSCSAPMPCLMNPS